MCLQRLNLVIVEDEASAHGGWMKKVGRVQVVDGEPDKVKYDLSIDGWILVKDIKVQITFISYLCMNVSMHVVTPVCMYM